ncbi:methyltransferase [Amycolatopsis sp. NPDC004079]|uniref:methyltransferase n=1 Tax=Amycolatopsis sp. NPDC004079 TaxID=3154549 RepID=UPI0033BC222D
MTADPTPRLRLFELATGYYAANALYTAARLGLADELAAGAVEYGELARRADADPAALLRLLRLLVAAGVLDEQPSGAFSLTDIGDGLRAGAEDSLRDVVLQFATPWQQRSWNALEHSVRTGRSGFEEATGTDVFAFLAANPAEAAVFDRSMTFFASGVARQVAESYDFSGLGTVADVGGGHGALLTAILESCPDLRGILFDLPHVIDQAREKLRGRPVRDRLEPVPGDFFTSVVSGADAYVLKSVIHDWDDRSSGKILTNCREAMPPDAVLLLVEMLRPESAEPSAESRMATGSDVNMLVHTGGRERTETEYRKLLRDNGFAVSDIVAVRTRWSGLRMSSIIEARPV